MGDQLATRLESHRGAGADGALAAARVSIGPLAAHERLELLDWLGAGLRGADTGTLHAEDPVAPAAAASLHARVRVGTTLASHALGRLVRIRARGTSLTVGTIGYVYTDPAWRNLGLARSCVTACTEKLAAGGALVVALWTDLDELYAPLGFRRAGVEWIYELDEASCRATVGDRRAALEIGPVARDEWSALEVLYAAKPTRADRPAGMIARLGAAPGCATLVARCYGTPVAYASLGRGGDFRRVVHEWAGDAYGVLSCFAELCATQGRLRALASPLDEEPLALLRAAGVQRELGAVGLLAVPDPVRLWRAVTCAVPALDRVSLACDGTAFRLRGDAGLVDLTYEETLTLLLGPTRPARIIGALSAAQYLTLRTTCPWPLYLWGFDSL